ncbi:hypothetical protein JHK82_040241 [Glycine max]|nr:hypothetical protein JHK85_041023 [Glycine max]KAG5111018.1 hypothetical protein JHK82_040241 [Glycine max]KAG5122308.1 hypothetical protein JHK84_040648 [Glycine max]
MMGRNQKQGKIILTKWKVQNTKCLVNGGIKSWPASFHSYLVRQIPCPLRTTTQDCWITHQCHPIQAATKVSYCIPFMLQLHNKSVPFNQGIRQVFHSSDL